MKLSVVKLKMKIRSGKNNRTKKENKENEIKSSNVPKKSMMIKKRTISKNNKAKCRLFGVSNGDYLIQMPFI